MADPSLATPDNLRAEAVTRVKAENPDADTATVNEFHEHFAGGVLILVTYTEKNKEYEAYVFFFGSQTHYFDDEEKLVAFVKGHPVSVAAVLALQQTVAGYVTDARREFTVHRAAGVRWDRVALAVGFASALISTLAGFMGLAEVQNGKVVVAALSVVAAALTGYLTVAKPQERAEKHTAAAAGFKSLEARANALYALCQVFPGNDYAILRRLREVEQLVGEVHGQAPIVSSPQP